MIPTNNYKISIRILFFIIVAIVFNITGCTHRFSDLTLVSTKNIDLNASKLDVRQGKRYKGSDCAFFFLGFIPFGIPSLQDAIDDALQKGGGNIMVDEVTWNRFAYFVIGSLACFDVEGTVLNGPEKSLSTTSQ